ncbi:MAG: hypothetical protein QM785_03790 [Pyrinomonadaceae bacterium]
MYKLRIVALISVLFLAPGAFAQNDQAYKLINEANTAKNKDKNCVKAIELYERSFAIKDFQRPSFYQAIASCYAQTNNSQRAFFYIDKMFAVGWIDSDALLKDEALKTLFDSPTGKKLLTKFGKAKADLLRSLSPSYAGLAENPSIKKIDDWIADPTINGENLFTKIASFNEFKQPKKKGIFVKFTNQFTDKISAPYYVYIPSKYDASRPHPLLVYSQGGWFQRKEFARDEAKEFVFENPVLPFVEKGNFIEIFPGAAGSVGTYQFEGIENIRQILAQVKQILNVDDNRVYMMGFSDGGTGTYRTSVFMPTAFAAFYPVNGRPYTGNRFVNMSNRPTYSLASTKDEVVEIDTIRSFFNFGRSVGADWTFREVADQGHYYLPFLEGHLPAIFDHIKAITRRPFRNELFWETSWEPIGKVDWIEIAQVDKTRTRTDWHKTYEYPLKSREGVETITIGDESGAVKARYAANTFDIQTSCIAKLSLNLHPAMVDLSQPVKVIVNGQIVFDQAVGYDKQKIAASYIANRDRTLVWANTITVDVPK